MSSRLSRLTRTFTFSLGLVYVGLFSLSVVLLFGFIYTYATRYLETQASEATKSRYAMLSDEFKQEGSLGLEDRIDELIASDDEGIEIYLLIDNHGKKISGNLASWPEYAVTEGRFEKTGSWIRFAIEGSRNHPGNIPVKAVAIPLSKTRTLLVGQSLINVKKMEQTIMQAFLASLALTLVMAFLGALIMTRSVIRRLSIINRSAQAIMTGNMSARIPYTPGGDEFDELSLALNRMLDRIETLLQSLSQFANNIAHDLRSPLNRILARTEAGLRGLKEASAARRLLERNVEDMNGLIGTFNSILKISELESNTEMRPFEPCNLTSLIEQLIDFYEPYAAEKRIRLESERSGPMVINGEKNLLTQAFANLIDNAIKFTPEGGMVKVRLRGTEDETEVAIFDTGPGIPAEYHEKVFEKFFRMEMSRHTSGNGLGLSLVAAIAGIHGAEIKLEDNAPGLMVRITFPTPSQPFET